MGFVGHAGGYKKFFTEFFSYSTENIRSIALGRLDHDFQWFFPSTYRRGKTLNHLRESNSLDTDFILRNRYRAGAKNEEVRAATEREFFTNIFQNLYTFCMRGTGNFSIRLYETLACGRIPVIVQTNGRFPLPWLKWEDHCVITSSERIEQDLLEFHQKLSEDELVQFQNRNRKFWQKYLTREGFFIEIHNHLIKRGRND
ncbi:hypothetical protein V6B16_13435 [Salinimicrobium catena]